MASSEPAINRIGFGIIAASLWILGLGALAGGGFYDIVHAHFFDFGEHHTAIGVVLIGIGTWFAYSSFRSLGGPKR